MSFLTVSRVGLPLIAGLSLVSFPKTILNDPKKQSRSFYSDDEELSFSPVLDTTEPHVTSPAEAAAAEPTQVVAEFVEGHKINTSSFLEAHLKLVRSKIIEQLNIAEAEYKNLKSAVTNEWNNATDAITSVYDPRDHFLPSFIYALTGALTGSILVNQRSLPVRFITPVAFGIAGFKFFLPHTFCNTLKAIKNYEAESLPEVLELQRSVKKMAIEAENSVEQLSKDAEQGLIESVRVVRESITK